MSPPPSKADDIAEGEFAPDWDTWIDTSPTAKLFIDDCLESMNYEDDWNVKTYKGLVKGLELCVMAETEDEINDAYVEQVEEFFARRYAVFKEIKDENLQQFQAKTIDDPAPLFANRKASICGRTGKVSEKALPEKQDIHLTKIDRYGLLTLSLIDARMHEEDKDCARNRVKIFYLNFLQFAVAVVVFALGSEELDGGHFPPLLASYVSAVVAVFSSVYGILGAIGENEGYLVKFMVANFWLMAILTAFLYTEIFMLKNTDNQCEPGKTSYGTQSKEGCDELVGTYATLLVMAVIQLAVVFIGAALATNVLDSVNDKTRLQQKQLFFTYFRIRNYEAKKFHQAVDPQACVGRQALDDDALDTNQLDKILDQNQME